MPSKVEGSPLNDPQAAIPVLLQVLSGAAGGTDVSGLIPELISSVFARPATTAQVRKLAYDVCRHANLSEQDAHRLYEIVRSDANSSEPEVASAALRFLPCLPVTELTNRLVVGELSELLTPQLSASSALSRAAAVQTLAAVLLMPEVQEAAAQSFGLANAYEGLWDALMDSMLDERPFVVGLAAAATAQLLACDCGGATAAATTPSATAVAVAAAATAALRASATGFMLSRVADRAAQRLAAALAPVLDMCALVPAPGQVAVCAMLLAAVRRMLAHSLRTAETGSDDLPPPGGVPVPGLPALVSSAVSYMAPLMQCADVPAKTEACCALLGLAADLAAAGPAAAGAAACLPQAVLLEAMGSLMQLREREFVEAGLADVVEVAAAAMPALTPHARAQVLRRLWPLLTRVADVSRRMSVCTLIWRTALDTEMELRVSGTRALPPTSLSAAALPPTGNNPLAPSTASDDPLGMLAAISAAAPSEPAQAGGVGAGAGEGGVVVQVPSYCSVVVMLGDPYVEELMAGRTPPVETAGTFTQAQATAVAALQSAPSSNTLTRAFSTARAAPPPPPGPKVERADSARGISVVPDAGASAAGGKAPKEKKGLFGGRLFGKSKSHKVKDGVDAGDGSSHTADVGVPTPDKKDDLLPTLDEEEPPAPRAGSKAPPGAGKAPPPLSLPTTNSVPLGASDRFPQGVSTPDVPAAALPKVTVPMASLRHEMLQTLLRQIAEHPAAAVAEELFAQHVAAARADRHPPTLASNPNQPRRLCTAVQWVALAADVLAECGTCPGWEPYVLPCISAQPIVSAAGKAHVDFSSLTADLWLGLLQGAVQGGRAVQALLGRLVAEAADAAAAAAKAEGAGGGMPYGGYGMPYGMAPGGFAAVQQAAAAGPAAMEGYYRGLLKHVDAKVASMQELLRKLLLSWPQLASATRPRVMWVAAHCLTLPGHWDERWEVLLSCLDHLLVRGTDVLTATRRADLLGSALAGSLFKAGRMAWAEPNKPFMFDIAAASALCEAPEYEVLGLSVGLAALQHLVGRLTNDVVAAVPHGAAGAAHGQVVAVARRLEALLKHFVATELAGAPHVRDWVKRIMRSLATLTNYAPPVNLPVTVAALGFIAKQEHESAGAGANGDADGDDSSDASSAYGGDDAAASGLALPPGLAAAAAAAAKGSTPALQQAASAQAAAASGGAAAEPSLNGDGSLTGRPRAGSTALSTSYLVHAPSAGAPMWGYPFASLTSNALHNSRRARRHRIMEQLLAAACARVSAPRPALALAGTAAGVGGGPAEDAGAGPGRAPALSGRTAYRLDQEALWAQLPASHSPWQELTGPADPVLLRGCYVRPDPADPATVVVMLSAINRLPTEVSGVALSLKTHGPLLPGDRKSAVGWELPRLAPHDRAATTMKFKLMGYGDLVLHPRLQLCPGPARTDATALQITCIPLELPAAVLLLRPPESSPTAAEFFARWHSLPARAELPGVCTWPGAEGAAVLVSALLRQPPLRCAWLQHVAATAGFQGGFMAQSALAASSEDVLAVLLTTQLMPPAAPGTPAESFLSLSVRSNSPDLVLHIQSSAPAWLQQLTSGTGTLGGLGSSGPQPPCARPPIHPRVAALQQSFAASAAQLASSGAGALAAFNSFGVPQEASSGGAAAAAAGGVGAAWLKNVALAEWQRLSSLSGTA